MGAALSSALPGSAYGGDVTWTNVAGGVFDDAANWSTSIVPGVSDNVVLHTSSAAPVTITFGSETYNGGLTVRNGDFVVEPSNLWGLIQPNWRDYGTPGFQQNAGQKILIGQSSGDDARLTVNGGGLVGIDMTLGQDAGARGTLVLQPGRGLGSTLTLRPFNASYLRIGFEGEGLLQTHGADVVGQSVFLGEKVSGSGTYDMDGGSLTATHLRVGINGAGTFLQRSGTVSLPNSSGQFIIGSDSSGTGRYEIRDGTLSSACTIEIGRSGTGQMVQSGGNVTAKLIDIGPKGRYELSGGALNATDIKMRYAGATFSFSGGTLNFGNFGQENGVVTTNGGDLVLGSPTGTVTYTMYTPARLEARSLRINTGAYFASQGIVDCPTITLAGGTMGSVKNYNTFIHESGSVDYEVVNYGTMKINGNMRIGKSTESVGGFTNYGTLSVQPGVSLTCYGNGFWHNAPLSLDFSLFARNETLGFSGTGTITQSGNTLHQVGNGMSFAVSEGSNWTYDLQAGTLSPYYAYFGRAGTAHLNITGTGVLDMQTSLTLGETATGFGELNVSGPDAKAGIGSLTVYRGNFTASDGAQIDGSLYIHDGTTVSTVRGPQTRWEGSFGIYGSTTGETRLELLDGATVYGGHAFSIGGYGYAGERGVLIVDGVSGSQRTTLSTIASPYGPYVGSGGEARMEITNGALVDIASSLIVADSSPKVGCIIVAGSSGGIPSELRVKQDLLIGRQSTTASFGGGRGTLTLGSGAVATASRTYIGATSAKGFGTLIMNGGSLTTNVLTVVAGSSIQFNSGHITVNGGTFAYPASDLILQSSQENELAWFTLNNTRFLRTGSVFLGGSSTAAGNAGRLEVGNGSTITISNYTKLWPTGTLSLAGGTYKTTSFSFAGGTVDWTGGSLILTLGDTSVGSGGQLGQLVDLKRSGGQTSLTVFGSTTILPGGTIAMNGGLFKTGQISLAGGSLVYNSGDFQLTSSDMTVGAGQLLGNDLLLTAGRTVGVSGTVTINPGASVTVDGGGFSAGTLINNGSFTYITGMLGGGTEFVVDTGGMFGPNLLVTAGKAFNFAQGFVVGKTNAGTMTLIDGGSASAGIGYVAQQAGSTGTVSLCDGSFWKINDSLYLGGSASAAGGRGTVTIGPSGTITATNLARIWSTGNLMIDGGTLLSGNVINGSTITMTGGSILSPTKSTFAQFNNQGTLVKTGDSEAVVHGTITNSGTVKVDAGTLTLRGWSDITGRYDVAAGSTLRFDANEMTLGSSAQLNVEGKLVFGPAPSTGTIGNLTINQPLTLAGDIEFTRWWSIGPGAIINAPLVARNVKLGVVNVNADITANGVVDLRRAGVEVWGTGTITAMGGLLMTTTGRSIIDVPLLRNYGPSTIDGGGQNAIRGRFENHSTGTIQISGGTSSGFYDIDNVGVIEHVSGYSGFWADRTFTNSGTLATRGGTWFCGAAQFNSSGHISVAPNSFMEINSDWLILSPQSTVVVGGELRIPTSHVNIQEIAGHWDVPGQLRFVESSTIHVMPGTTFDRLANLSIEFSTVKWDAGEMTVKNLNIQNGGALVSSADITVTDSLTWWYGDLSGAGRLFLNGTTICKGGSARGRDVRNAGTLTFENNGINVGGGSLTNLPGAVVSTGHVPAYVRGGVFKNAGRLVVTGTDPQYHEVGRMVVDELDNSGTVEINSTSLLASRFGDTGGTVNIGQSAVFAVGDCTISPTTTITNNGTMEFGRPRALDPINFSGSYTTTGTTSFGSYVVVNFQPGAQVYDLGDVYIESIAHLNLNTGHAVEIHDLLVNNPSGISGLWLGGTDPLTITGTIKGESLIHGWLVNGGQMSPGNSPGTIEIDGTYQQQPTASLIIELTRPDLAGPGQLYSQQWDRLTVDGLAMLAGTLDVRLLDDFVPEYGQSFAVLEFTSRVGDFTTFKGMDLPNGMHFEPVFTSNSLTLQVVPEPAAVSVFGIATACALARRRRRAAVGR